MKHKNGVAMVVLFILFGLTLSAAAQTSSIGVRQRTMDERRPPINLPRLAPKPAINPVYERYSWVSLVPPPPKKFRVNDLLTIIVRQRRLYEADADLKTKKSFEIESTLEAFFKPTGGGLGAAVFRRGKPAVDYEFENQLRSRADTSREDRLTTRVTARILDVKPNGTLVIEGRAGIAHDDEISEITITGICRKEDVTADNTVLSSQIADLNITIANRGALRAATSRGWILKTLDWLRPF